MLNHGNVLVALTVFILPNFMSFLLSLRKETSPENLAQSFLTPLGSLLGLSYLFP